MRNTKLEKLILAVKLYPRITRMFPELRRVGITHDNVLDLK